VSVENMKALPAAAVADAIVRMGGEVRMAVAGVHRAFGGAPVVGPCLPVRHFGSVDVFLEAFERASPGAVLVIDNEGRDDEACIGDLTVAEAGSADVAGIVLWGYHRDSAILRELPVPVWSLGSVAPGPRSARTREGDPFSHAHVGSIKVTATDLVVADDDGVVFVAADLWPAVSASAAQIVQVEARQAELIASGQNLRQQLGFRDFLTRRADDPSYTLRRHLAERGGAIET
jgi:4-hydroxy-4-methyl-2-oxoglutarate aldolase